MDRLIFIFLIFTSQTFSQVDLSSFNNEIKRVSNNWAQTINKGVDTNNVVTKKIINKTNSDGQIKYYKTKEGYSKMIKTFITWDSTGQIKNKIVLYSLGTWPLQIERYKNGKNIENLYYDKSNLMAWEKNENQFVDINDKDFHSRNLYGLDLFDRAIKAAKSKDDYYNE